MHENNIILRDLNLKDIVIDNKGKVNIIKFEKVKFGINEISNGKLSDSIVPEIILGRKHGKAADWYLIGTLIYEMIIGITPYYSSNSCDIASNILNSKLKITKNLSSIAKDILIKLLNRDPD